MNRPGNLKGAGSSRKRKAADDGGGSSAAVPASPAAPKEKRLKRYKSAPNSDTLARIYRALSQRMYLIEQVDESNGTGGLARKYAVLGSTGNVYNVTISQLPTCTCPDCARGKLCKHIIFVLARVLQVPRDSPLIYQSALLQGELKEIFEKAPAPGGVQANSAVISAYKKTVTGSQEMEPKPDKPEKPAAVNDKVPEGECPVCFENLQTTEQLDSCAVCRNYIHKDCLQKWLRMATAPTCCYCRSPWCSFGATPSSSSQGRGGTAVPREEGYVNLASQQGLSGQRDTSTYHTSRWSRYGRYGYGYGDDDDGGTTENVPMVRGL